MAVRLLGEQRPLEHLSRRDQQRQIILSHIEHCLSDLVMLVCLGSIQDDGHYRITRMRQEQNGPLPGKDLQIELCMLPMMNPEYLA